MLVIAVLLALAVWFAVRGRYRALAVVGALLVLHWVFFMSPRYREYNDRATAEKCAELVGHQFDAIRHCLIARYDWEPGRATVAAEDLTGELAVWRSQQQPLYHTMTPEDKARYQRFEDSLAKASADSEVKPAR